MAPDIDVMAPDTDELVLAYSHNVIDHLGLKLYQNKPTRVIAELVSNSWDADSETVWVEKEMVGDDRWVAVHDIGKGMTRQDLKSRYLVIGAPKRAAPDEKSSSGRRLMGRKGIGKLAPFGIARCVEVVTAARGSAGSEVHWIRLDLSRIRSNPAEVGNDNEDKQRLAEYRPDILYQGSSLEKVDASQDPTGQVGLFVSRVAKAEGTGTLILLRDLTLKRAIPSMTLIESLGQRFTATLGHGFSVHVGNLKVDVASALPEFEFRVPDSGWAVDIVEGMEVRHWAGFVEKADWPADSAGVGVYSHGKICQNRPFTFGARGKEIFTRYMYAVVEADWLDEQDEDLISTDRTSVNWEAPAAVPLLEWGRSQVGSWVAAFQRWRATREKAENRSRVSDGIKKRSIPAITDQEQEQVADLLSEITPSLGKDEEAKERLADAVASAWIQEPMRGLIKQLWGQLSARQSSIPGAFATLVEQLVEHSVPESLNLAVVFAQRAFALSKLYDLVHNGREVDLQRLIEQFPWIIEPDTSYLTADQTLRTVVSKAEQEGLAPSGRRTVVAGVSEKNKPDFVFLSSPDHHRIVVVELKNPQEDITIANRQQLADYLTFLEVHYPEAELQGYLVGRIPNGLKIQRGDMKAIPWTDVMKKSRARHIVFLAAVLSSAGTGSDARVDQVREFGGEEVWRLLRTMSERNETLSLLFEQYDSTSDGRGIAVESNCWQRSKTDPPQRSEIDPPLPGL